MRFIAIDVPETGGDTTWVNLYEAYDSLSDSMKTLCSNLTAVHDNFQKIFLVSLKHMEARVMRWQGRRLLRENIHWFALTLRQVKSVSSIVSLWSLILKSSLQVKGQYLRSFLIDHIKKPELACRFKWENHSVAFWDNRCTAHRGIFDFGDAHRLMHRVAIQGETKPS
ncbi:MAG: hypothetical protein Ct9H90mP13_07120 [Pseudomonadota bacterium]|nr:MAG: hypothetical protein Ct9H90mP13_07120 [Pseudomonadota bacterium]